MTETITTEVNTSPPLDTESFDKLFFTKLPFAETTLQTCIIQFKDVLSNKHWKAICAFVESLFKSARELIKETCERDRYKLGACERSRETGLYTIHFAHPSPSIVLNILTVWINYRLCTHTLMSLDLVVKTLTVAKLEQAEEIMSPFIKGEI